VNGAGAMTVNLILFDFRFG